MGRWQIAVQPSDRKQYYIDVDEDGTLKEVFDEISKHQWIDVIYLDIVFQGKTYRYDLHKDTTLKSIDMRNRCLLVLTGRMKGGLKINKNYNEVLRHGGLILNKNRE